MIRLQNNLSMSIMFAIGFFLLCIFVILVQKDIDVKQKPKQNFFIDSLCFNMG